MSFLLKNVVPQASTFQRMGAIIGILFGGRVEHSSTKSKEDENLSAPPFPKDPNVSGKIESLCDSASTTVAPEPPPRKGPNIYQVLDKDFIDKYEAAFVIGDVHGCITELKDLLEMSGTESDNILKIFVGDLVNKGPSSVEVLQFVMDSNSLSVRGNNEEAVLKELEYLGLDPSYELSSKYSWIMDLSTEQILYLRSLPYVLSIPSLKTLIVHAGIVPGKTLSMQNPQDLINMRNVVLKDYFEDDGGVQAVYKTNRGFPWASMWRGPSHVYFGHDAKRGIQICEHATGLDTGCVYGRHLTGAFINCGERGQIVSIRAHQVYNCIKPRICIQDPCKS